MTDLSPDPFPSTKTPILCSKCPKTRVPDPKSAQKCRFCARNARKRGLRRPKKHKNADSVLEAPENKGKIAHSDTKKPFSCSKRPKTREKLPILTQKSHFRARNARKWGLRRPKKHKNADFVLERIGIGIGKHNRRDAYRKRCLPANHRARFKNANTS